MKRLLNNIWLIAFFITSTTLFASCNDDDEGGQPVIESIRVTDPTLADDTFTQATPGKMIVIQGRNLGGCLELYINDQKVGFNPNMNTNHSIITTIPTEENDDFKLTAWHPELASEIRVVTRSGVATFDFKVLAPKPVAERIAGRYPRIAGDNLTVYGTNFLDVSRVYFSDVNPLNPSVAIPDESRSTHIEIDVTDYALAQNRYLDEKSKKYVTESEMKFTLPELPFVHGFIVIVTPQGRTALDYAALPPVPVIKALSSDMPIPGTRVTIKGSYFIDVTGIKIGDEMTILENDIEVAENESELTFVLHEKPTQTTTISVVTPGGTSNEFCFYPYETLFIDFDDMTNVVNLNRDPAPKYLEATPDAPPYISDGNFCLYDGVLTAWNYWGTMLYWETAQGNSFKFADFDVIPADTPLEKVYLKFEIYNDAPFKKIFQYRFMGKDGKNYDWENWNSNKVHIIPEFQDQFGDQKYGEWYTAVLPLSQFAAFAGKTYSDFVNANLYRIRLQLYNKTGEAVDTFICLENIRISMIETYDTEQ